MKLVFNSGFLEQMPSVALFFLKRLNIRKEEEDDIDPLHVDSPQAVLPVLCVCLCVLPRVCRFWIVGR